MRRLTSRDYLHKRWKNGGGMLTDIAMSPAGAGLDAFDWRVSAAHVGISGPFSMFPGIDRGMVVLNGEGMRLDIAGQPTVTLGIASAPLMFPGDVPTLATLTAGPVDDLNAMTRRDRFRQSMRRETLSDERTLTPSPGGAIILYIEAGSLTGNAEAESAIANITDTLIIETPTRVAGQPSARVCWIEIIPLTA
jgi:uncharacterized protein